MWAKVRLLCLPALLVAAFFAVPAVSSADTAAPVATTTAPGAVVSASFDFGVQNVGILPISPLYFLKEWRRDIIRSITKDPFSLASFELSVLNEKGAEMQGVEGFKPSDTDAVALSLDVYQNSVDRVKTSAAALIEQDPADVNAAFLEYLSRETALHISFLDALAGEYADDQQIVARTDIAKHELGDVAEGVLASAAPETFAAAVKELLPGAPVATGTTPASVAVAGTLEGLVAQAVRNAATSTQEMYAALLGSVPAASSTSSVSSTVPEMIATGTDALAATGTPATAATGTPAL